jgi:lipopolysaccharide biosynthesis glycosyltransferase
MINILYCFDENYNFQAFSSIISLLDHVSEKLNIFIIHKTESDEKFFPKKILLHENLNKINIFKFDKKVSKFPNLFDAHISEATYYRLFCADYLPINIETIFYIDADIICVENPINLLKADIKNLVKENNTISVKTEILRSANSLEVFERLNMISNRYFNAGVMNINLQNWIKMNIDFNEKLKEYNDKLNYWDQDLLNHVFDGNYQELDPRLNKVIDFAFYEYKKDHVDVEKVINKSSLIHFAGSHKPWSVNGIMSNLSEIYQLEFRKISTNNFHITHKIRSMSIGYLFKNIMNLKFFKIDSKFQFTIELIKSLFKIKVKKKDD